jgi:hypothetical protein
VSVCSVAAGGVVCVCVSLMNEKSGGSDRMGLGKDPAPKRLKEGRRPLVGPCWQRV